MRPSAGITLKKKKKQLKGKIIFLADMTNVDVV